MKIPRRLRRVKFEAAAHHTTSFAGLRFVFDVAMKLGVVQDLRALTVKKRRRGIPIEDFVMGLAANFVIGGDSLTDLQVLRDETVTRRLCYDLEVPAPTTAGERLRTFSRGHLAQLEAVNRRAARSVLAGVGGSGPMTVDLDSSIFEVYGYLKEGARYGYSGVRGLHPLLAFVHEGRLLLGARLRAGNRASADGVERFLPQVLQAIRRLLRPGRGAPVRRAPARLQHLRQAHEPPAGRHRRAARERLATLPLGGRRRVGGVPLPAPRLVARVPAAGQAHALVREGPARAGRVLPHRAITNLSGAGSSLIRYHLGRGGMENYIEEFKHGLGAAHLPSQHFHANAAWLLIAALAYNLAQVFKLLLLKSEQHADQLKKLRLHWFNVAARWIRTGRRWLLALARGPDTVAAFSRVQALLAAL